MRFARSGLAALALILLSAFRALPDGPYAGVGSPVPDAVLGKLEGGQVTLSEVRTGWTLLKLGTTWCPQCTREVVELNRLAEELELRRIEVVEVFLREDATVVRKHLRSRPRRYPFRVLLDPAGNAIPAFQVRLIPRLLLVDPEGIVRMDSRFQTATQLRASLARVLEP